LSRPIDATIFKLRTLHKHFLTRFGGRDKNRTTLTMAIIRTTSGYTHKVSNKDLAVSLQEEEAWAMKLRQALVHGAAYDEDKHCQLAKEMDSIEERLGNYAGGTIFDHIRSIFDDAATRGFQHDLHFPELLNQYRRYGFGEPPKQWIPPHDAQSRCPSPLLPPVATPALLHSTASPTTVTTPNILPSDAASAAIKRTGDAFVGRSPEQPESSTSRSKPKAKVAGVASMTVKRKPLVIHRPRNVPAAAIRYYPGCSRCRDVPRPCWALQKNNDTKTEVLSVPH